MCRRVVAAALAILLVSAVASCSIPVNGRVGIGRDHQGVLRVYIRSCGAVMSYAALEIVDDPSSTAYPAVPLAEWHILREARSLQVDWPLIGLGVSVVAATRPLREPMTSAKRVQLSAWDASSDSRSEGPWNFALADLGRLKPGEVLTINPATAAAANAVVAVEDFNQIDCSQFG